jgi:hypothetical protein
MIAGWLRRGEGAGELLDASPAEAPAGATAEVAAQARTTLWDGRTIRGYAVQFRVWALIIALIFASAVAGAYFGLWQVHWYLPFGAAWMRHGFWLKPWWDAGTFWPRWLGHWVLYRHVAFRDQLEPGIGCLGALTVMARPRWWGVRIGIANLAARMAAVPVLAIALGILGVWLNFFGLPWLWAHAWSAVGRSGYNWDGAFAWAGESSLFILAWGILIMGPVLHRFWAPAGATINGFIMARSADRARDKTALDGQEHVPLWVREPGPPNLRYRWSGLYLLPDNGLPLVQAGMAKRVILTLIIVVFTWLVILGVVGHYVHGVGGINIPYLAPGGS